MKMFKDMFPKDVWKRLTVVVIALFFLGLGIQCLVAANAGVEAASVWNYGLSNALGISFGTAQIITNSFLFITAVCFDRSRVGLGTIVGLIIVGYAADFFGFVFKMLCPGIYSVTGVARVLLLMAGILIVCFCAATYMICGLGVSPLDMWPFIISKWLPKVSFKIIRYIYDAMFIIGGVLLGEKIGVVTIGTLFLMGPTIVFMGKQIKKLFPPTDPN